MAEERSVGALLGVVCGDILGSHVEGMEAQIIEGTHGRVKDFLDEEGRYTDDTQMTIALGDSLVEHGGISLADVAEKYSDYFHSHRGYSDSTTATLTALSRGLSWEVSGRVAHRDGSYGNGGSMRIAPVGIAYRNADDVALRSAVVDACIATHTHPEALDAAFIQAKAISVLVKTDPANFTPIPFLETLLNAARTDIIKSTIQKVINQVRRYVAAPADTSLESTTGDDVIGNGSRASDTVGSALLMFSRFWKTPEDALINAVGLGGDTDTIASHTGALVGALHGSGWVPKRWFDKIENGKQGRDYIIELAKKLAKLDCTKSEGSGEKVLKDQEDLIARGAEFAFEQERNEQVQQLLVKIDSKLSLQRISSRDSISSPSTPTSAPSTPSSVLPTPAPLAPASS